VFEATVITLREGVEVALVLSIALHLLRRRRTPELAGALFTGAAGALVASVAAAWAMTRITVNEELAEGIVLLASAVLVFTLVWWMWRAAPRMREEVEAGLERAASTKLAWLAVFVFGFIMVFREGLETAVFLSAARFNSEGLGMWIGAGVGIALAAAFGVLFLRGMLRVPLGPFFRVTSLVLILLGVQLVIGGLHELSEAGAIPSSKTEMALIGPIVKNELLLFTLTVAVIAGWLLFAPAGATPPAAGPGGAAARRLEQATLAGERGRRRWTGAVALVVVGLLSTAFVQSARVPERPPATRLDIRDGGVRFDAAPLADGALRFFETELDGERVRFFAIRVGDRVQTCFDGCEICGSVGYFQEGPHVVCRNCTSPIALRTLGRAGGCNPIPLESRAEGDVVLVGEDALRRARSLGLVD
jgi:FTR1 family protein